MRTHDPYAALRHANYRWVLCCHVLTILAGQIQATALGWLLYERTGSAAVLGFSGLVIFLPVLLLALPVGFFVDSHSRKIILLVGIYILIAGSLGMALFTATVAPVSLLFIALGISGIGNACLSVSRSVIMRDVIPSHLAENGINWSILGRRISTVVGSLLAGCIVGFSGGAEIAFLVSAAAYIIALVCSVQIVLPTRTEPGEPMTLRSLTEGVRFIKQTPLILSATLLDMFAVLLGGAMGLLPIFAKDILHVGATGLGLLYAAPSIGSGIMAFLLAHRPPMRRAGMALLASVAAYGAMTIVFGISVSPLLSFCALFFIGVFDAVSITVRATILQIFVPNRFRGRVYGVNMVFVYSSNELGDFESGMVAAFTGAPASVVLGGAAAVCLALFFGWKWKELRQLGTMRLVEEPLVA